MNSETVIIGGDYISNLGDSDGLTDVIAYGADDDAISGAAIFTELTLGAVTVFAEYLGALDGYSPENNAEPSASQIEAAYELGRFTYVVSYQQTDDAAFLDLPEERVSVGLSTEIFNSLGLGIELARDEDYRGDMTTNFVMQIAAEF